MGLPAYGLSVQPTLLLEGSLSVSGTKGTALQQRLADYETLSLTVYAGTAESTLCDFPMAELTATPPTESVVRNYKVSSLIYNSTASMSIRALLQPSILDSLERGSQEICGYHLGGSMKSNSLQSAIINLNFKLHKYNQHKISLSQTPAELPKGAEAVEFVREDLFSDLSAGLGNGCATQ